MEFKGLKRGGPRVFGLVRFGLVGLEDSRRVGGFLHGVCVFFELSFFCRLGDCQLWGRGVRVWGFWLRLLEFGEF